MFIFLWKKQNGAKNTARTMFCFRYNITENCKIEKIKFKKKKKKKDYGVSCYYCGNLA